MNENEFKIYLNGIEELNDFELPVNPIGGFKVKANNKFEIVDTLGLGEIILLRHNALQEFGWSSYFPMGTEENKVITGRNTFKDPNELAELFKTAENTTLTLTINKYIDGTYEPYINTAVILKDFQTEDKGGEPGDVYYSIQFTEYEESYSEKCEILPVIAPLTLLASNTPIQQTKNELDFILYNQTHFYCKIYI